MPIDETPPQVTEFTVTGPSGTLVDDADGRTVNSHRPILIASFSDPSRGELDAAVRVGVASSEGPAAIVERADLTVEGTAGFLAVLDGLAQV